MNIPPLSDKTARIENEFRGPAFDRSQELAAQGIPVTWLNIGDPDVFGFGMPESVRRAVIDNLDRAVGYSDCHGLPEVCEAILRYHRSRGIENISARDVFTGNGISELAQMTVAATLSAGDELLVPSPEYSVWTNAAHLALAKPVFYTCDEQACWTPDPADLEKKVTPRTKAVVLINPNNPTGQVFPPETVRQVADFARRHGLMIFSDEIYDRLIFEDAPFASTAALAPDLPVVTLNGLSKSHIVCGFRCAWALVSGPERLTVNIREGIARLAAMRLCSNLPGQLAIPAALNDPESTRAMLVPGGRLYEQRKAACEELDRLQARGLIRYSRPMAAFYVFPAISEEIPVHDDKKLALDLLNETHILLVPGSGFGWPKPNYFRLILLPEPDTLRQAVRDIGDFLEHYHQ